jgi:hypothetical protein
MKHHPENENGRSANVLQFIFQTKLFSLALTYDPDTLKTTALLLGLKEDEILEIFTRLHIMAKSIFTPMVVVDVIIDVVAERLNNNVHLSHKELNRVKKQIGLGKTQSKTMMEKFQPEILVSSEPNDIVVISRDLTNVATKQAQFLHQAEVLLSVSEYLNEASDLCLEKSLKRFQSDLKKRNILLRHMIAYKIRYIKSTIARVNLLSRRAAAYVQIVRKWTY